MAKAATRYLRSILPPHTPFRRESNQMVRKFGVNCSCSYIEPTKYTSNAIVDLLQVVAG